MRIPPINKREPLAVVAGVSKLSRVWLARAPQPVLLKEPAQFWDEIFIANEAHMLEAATHPRIRKKLAYSAQTHQLYLEYVEGRTLYELVQAGITQADPARAHVLLQKVAETLADLHAGIWCAGPMVHNDFKSLNVLVPTAFPTEPVLIDFSHSFFAGRLPPFITERKQHPAGTAKYMAPEKWTGDFTHGFKSDVFAFGVLAYFVYSGHYPFAGEGSELEQQIREAVPLSLTERGVQVPRSTMAIMEQCLEKNPDRRPTMDHVARYYAESASLFVGAGSSGR